MHAMRTGLTLLVVVALATSLRSTPAPSHALARCSATDRKVKPFCACFAPGTDPETIKAFEAQFFPVGAEAFSALDRWTLTATNGYVGGTIGNITITYSFPPDGVLSVPDNVLGPGITTINNELHATLDASFGSTTAWKTLFRQMFDDWQDLTGIVFVEEPADDGAAWISSAGVLGTRGDIRIVAIQQDGVNGVLAYNFYPDTGDMALDKDENWHSALNDYRFMRNILMHELGHGLGLGHVAPTNGTKLMEPYLSTSFDGPQDDDIRGAQYLYGDADEGNASSGAATNCGAFSNGLTRANRCLHAGDDVDWYRFTASGGATVSVTIAPIGASYSVGPDGGYVGPIDTRAILPLEVALYDDDGTTLLREGLAASAGESAATAPVILPGDATAFFVRVATGSSDDDTQRYTLTLDASPGAPLPITVTSEPNSAVYISASPDDTDSKAAVSTPGYLLYDLGATVTLTAPQSAGDDVFERWQVNGVDQAAGQRTLTLDIDGPIAANAVYGEGFLVDVGNDRTLVPGELRTLHAITTGGREPYSYSWSPTTGLSSATVASPVASPSATTTYTVTVTDADGLEATDSITLTKVAALVASAGADRTVVAGKPTTLTGSASGGSGGYAYYWSPSENLSNSMGQSVTATLNADTTVTLTVTDSDGHSASDSVALATVPLLTVSLGSNRMVIRGDKTVLSATIAGGVPEYSLSWVPSTGSIVGATSYAINPTETLTWTVLVTDQSGQQATDGVRISVVDPLSATAATSASEITIGEACTLSASTSGGASPLQVAWSPSESLSAPNSMTTTATPSETTTYTLTVRDVLGQTAVAQVTVKVDDLVAGANDNNSGGNVPDPVVLPAPMCGFGVVQMLAISFAALLPRRIRRI